MTLPYLQRFLSDLILSTFSFSQFSIFQRQNQVVLHIVNCLCGFSDSVPQINGGEESYEMRLY